MRPVLQNNKISRKLWILYGLIFIICTIGIGIALYMQFFQDENLGAVVGITSKDSEEEDEYDKLKEEFNKIFTNQLESLQSGMINVDKINSDYDIVVTAYRYEKDEENCKINVYIPYINVNDNSAKTFNQQMKEEYKEKAEILMNQVSSINIIYSVEYRAYIQNNILSLAIRSEFKEGDKSQKIMLQTFNYNLTEKRETTIDEILNLKNIEKENANTKIKNEIKTIQNQKQALIELGYQLYERDYNSEMYNISNSKYFLYGQNGMLYIIYPYGNEEDTSEMDIIIFQ